GEAPASSFWRNVWVREIGCGDGRARAHTDGPWRQLGRGLLSAVVGGFEAHSESGAEREEGGGDRRRLHRDGSDGGAGAKRNSGDDGDARGSHLEKTLHAGDVAVF